MRIHSVTLPDGTTAKRTSERHDYGFAIAVLRPCGRYDYDLPTDTFLDHKGRPVNRTAFVADGRTEWIVAGWSADLKNAGNKAQTERNMKHHPLPIDVKILPCTKEVK